ncbi:hypothetical protein CYLTODRAFT_494940 [Cylindrobasidium torrendii FP15055 ss-10]|uniref:BTB domain-containing protein n=1 Tax=Cylindrobasidium torrendii FP15055 ss-10 TaxID=1314674 RepID=A0A0D7AUV5_9AGAR|nr:hypothetical protein CYLTODRAFT_494940 [Cylindrobasidium torrendii FP15055 ss-10]
MELLKKVESDRLTGSPPTLTIQSTFEIPPSAFDAVAPKKSWTSESCGLGWTFNLKPNGYAVHNGILTKMTACQLYINFDAAFLSQPTHQIKSVQCVLDRREGLGLTDCNVDLCKNDLPVTSSVHIGALVHFSSGVTLPTTLTCLVALAPRMEARVGGRLGTERIASFTLDSMTGEHFVDTKVYAYTRRSRGGAINPHSFFIHSTIVHQYGCEPLSLLFGKAEDFHSENALLDLHRLPESKESLVAVDYQDDSDLEDEDEVDARGHHSHEPKIAQEHLQSIPVDSEDESKDPKGEKRSDTASSISQETTLPHIVRNASHAEIFEVVGQYQNALRYGRIKVLSNGAYRTWHAIIQYIYTGRIEFAPLRSTKRPRPTSKACSPKSVYRIAAEYGMDALKTLAFEEVSSNITVDNVLEEIFSSFAHMYPEVYDFCMRNVIQWRKTSEIQTGILVRLQDYGEVVMEDHEKKTMKEIVARLIP